MHSFKKCTDFIDSMHSFKKCTDFIDTLSELEELKILMNEIIQQNKQLIQKIENDEQKQVNLLRNL